MSKKRKNAAGQVLKNEAKGFAKTGNTYIVLVVALLFVFLFFSVIMPTAIDSASVSRAAIGQDYRDRMTGYYLNRIEVLDARKAGGEGQLEYLRSDLIAHEKYIFLVSHGTIEEDYFKLDNIYANYKEDRAAVNMIFAADTSCILLMLLAVLLALALVFKGMRGAREKYAEAGISGRDVTVGRIWLCEIVMAVCFAALLAVGLAFGAGNTAAALIYSFGWRAVNPVLVYIARMAGAFALMQIMFFISLAAEKLMKSKPLGVITPVVIYAFALSLSAMLLSFPFAGQPALRFIPLLSLQFAVTYAGSLSFILSALLHLAAAAALAAYVAHKKKRLEVSYE